MFGMKQTKLQSTNLNNPLPSKNEKSDNLAKSSKTLQSLSSGKSNTSPNFNKKRDNQENSEKDKFKNSTVLKNATENLFLSSGKLPSGSSQTAQKNLFSNTLNFPETVISLHNSINNRPEEKNSHNQTQKDNLSMRNTDPFKGTNYNYTSGRTDPQLSQMKIYPSLVTPQLNRMTHMDSENYGDKQVINLEDLYIAEEKLWAILESLRYNSSISFACEDYFEFLSMTSIHSVENYFNQSESKQVLCSTNILEIISTISVIISAFKNKLNSENNVTHLKNLIFNVHQNFLVIVKIILSRLPREFESNMWATRLFSIVQNKQVKFFDNKDSHDLFNLKQNNLIIHNCVSKYISANFRMDMQIYEVMMDILGNLDKYSYSTVKNILFNIVRIIVSKKIILNLIIIFLK
jgi:hypothetical protein